jgi:hypothetical protein
LLVRPEDAPDVPRLDTTELHCSVAVDWMLAWPGTKRAASGQATRAIHAMPNPVISPIASPSNPASRANTRPRSA